MRLVLKFLVLLSLSAALNSRVNANLLRCLQDEWNKLVAKTSKATESIREGKVAFHSKLGMGCMRKNPAMLGTFLTKTGINLAAFYGLYLMQIHNEGDDMKDACDQYDVYTSDPKKFKIPADKLR